MSGFLLQCQDTSEELAYHPFLSSKDLQICVVYKEDKGKKICIVSIYNKNRIPFNSFHQGSHLFYLFFFYILSLSLTMVPEQSNTFLVTGAARGIGRELVKQLSNIPDAKVIAAVRNIDPDRTKSLRLEHPNVIIIKIDSEVDTDAFEAVKELKQMGIEKVDTIFANAGLMTDASEAIKVKSENLQQLFHVNTIAPLLLFQAFQPLLQSSVSPRFVVLSTIVSSIASQSQLPIKTTSYGSTKVALNFIMVRLAIENRDIITFALHPGTVTTDMAAFAIGSMGQTLDQVLRSGLGITPQQSVEAIIKRAKEATLQDTSGTFLDVTNGQVIPW